MDSANGRILVWLVTMNMIFDKLIGGYGIGGFQTNYMNYQSHYLQNTDSEYFRNIADNVVFPYNEYLNIIVDFGFLGLIFVSLYFYYVIKSMKERCSNIKLIFVEIIIAFSIISFFSYPSFYYYSYFFIVVSIIILFPQKRKVLQSSPLKYMIIFICFIVSSAIIDSLYCRYKWGEVFSYDLKDKKLRYSSLYSKLNNNSLFLYEYALCLNMNNCYDESNDILFDILNLQNSYEIQMLFADNYIKVDSKMALYHLDIASNMCPNRFLPLFKMLNVYIDIGDVLNANLVAKKIVDKRIKVESPIVDYIKRKAFDYLNESTYYKVY